LETIVRYLKNPLAVGVYSSKFRIDFSGLVRLLEEWTQKKFVPYKIREIAMKIEKEKEKEKQHWREKDLFDMISEIVDKLPRENFEGKHGDLLKVRVPGLEPQGSETMGDFLRRRFNIFGACTFPYINDVLYLERKSKWERDQRRDKATANVWFLDVITIKKNGTELFKEMIKIIPYVGESLEVLEERRTFSSQLVFRPYPLAVRLWLEDEESIFVPDDLQELLLGAIRHHLLGEWRMSIVLSAITVESLLANLYEENFQRNAPNISIGELCREISEKILFPDEIRQSIEMANDARIIAVHRSDYSLKVRDSTNALFGATNCILWRFSKSRMCKSN